MKRSNMDYYERLREKLDLFPIGLPKTEDSEKLLKLLFSEEDARVAAEVPNPPLMFTAGRIAGKAGMKKQKVAGILASMAERGLIVEANLLGENRYTLVPPVPGFMEMQFMMGREIDEKRREAGRLWHESLHREFGRENYGYKTSGVRVVPIKKTIDARQTVFNFEEVGKIVKASGSIAVTDCACRKSAQKCDAPLDVCMAFGVSADYLVGKGIARKVGRSEAMKVFERAADAGLVSTSTNTMPPVGIICNCCKCCCASLRGVTALNMPAETIRSNFCSTSIEGADCKLCKVCVKSCPVEAISAEGDRITVQEDKCIGCGVCVHKCDRKALALIRKSDVRPPLTSLHLMTKMYGERGKTGRVLINAVKDILE